MICWADILYSLCIIIPLTFMYKLRMCVAPNLFLMSRPDHFHRLEFATLHKRLIPIPCIQAAFAFQSGVFWGSCWMEGGKKKPHQRQDDPSHTKISEKIPLEFFYFFSNSQDPLFSPYLGDLFGSSQEEATGHHRCFVHNRYSIRGLDRS